MCPTPGNLLYTTRGAKPRHVQGQYHNNNLVPEFDEVAAVKWVLWGDQWVSYDDGESILK
jgi:hypothetical protein